VPLVVGVGAAGTREAIELARHAEGVGVDAVLIVSPFYWKVGEEALNKLDVPISPAVRGPALPIREEAHEKVESVLREEGLPTVREVG
jgi:4-hydroxy-tetrahydrodipicolinate synthase